MTDAEKLDSILTRLDRLELIESHLLDILIPQRRAFLRQPQVAPPSVVGDDVKKIYAAVSDLHAKMDGLHEKIDVATAPEPEIVKRQPEAHG